MTLAGAPITGRARIAPPVFQHDALLPWLDVRDNVAFALELQGVDGRRERHARAEALLAEVGLAPRRPSAGVDLVWRHASARRHRPRAGQPSRLC